MTHQEEVRLFMFRLSSWHDAATLTERHSTLAVSRCTVRRLREIHRGPDVRPSAGEVCQVLGIPGQ